MNIEQEIIKLQNLKVKRDHIDFEISKYRYLISCKIKMFAEQLKVSVSKGETNVKDLSEFTGIHIKTMHNYVACRTTMPSYNYIKISMYINSIKK